MIDKFFDWVHRDSLWAREYLLVAALLLITFLGCTVGFAAELVCAILGTGYRLSKQGLTKLRP